SWTTGRAGWIGAVRHVGRRLAQLGGELRVAGLEQPDERTLGERPAHRLDFGELVAPAKDVEELRRLAARAAERPPLIEHDAPGDDREEPEYHEHGAGDRGRPGEERDYRYVGSFGRNPSLRLQEQGHEQASERAQTSLRI